MDEDEVAVEELVTALKELVEELVEDRGSQLRPVDCGQDVGEEQAQLQEEMECARQLLLPKQQQPEQSWP